MVFLDGYAGRGQYADGTPGSPLLLARTAARVEGTRAVIGVYVEHDRTDYTNLQQVMAPHRREGDYLFCGDLSDHLPQILRIAQGAAMFAFLDPFGTALDRDQLVGPLLGRCDRAPVEVLLHISVSSVARLGGLFRRRREQGAGLSPADRKSIDHLDRFLGGQWWQAHFEPVHGTDDEEQATEAALRVAEQYQRDVCASAGCQAVSMPIRRRPDQLPKYVLVLFTRHGDGMWHFADILGRAGREWEGAWRGEEARSQLTKAMSRHSQPGLFDIDELIASPAFDPGQYEKQHRNEWENIVATNLQRLLTAGPFVLAERVVDAYGMVLGAAGERHVRAAVKALHASGVITNTGVGRYFFRERICPALS